MMIKLAIAGMLTMGSGLAWHALAADQLKQETCAPSGNLNFVCGSKSPEDIVVLPGNRWIVASGMTLASGLHLIDTRTKTSERWIAPTAAAPKAPYNKCPSQPKPDEFQAHGISVRDRGHGQATLYVVNHGSSRAIDPMGMAVGSGHETIEVFNIDLRGAKPVLSWTGCIPTPGSQLVANSVVSAADGSVYATVMLHPNNVLSQMFKGEATGAVYKWTPDAGEFKKVDGTELPGNNGIELSHDGKTLYVASSPGAITSFTNTVPARRLRSIKTRIGVADNIHWVNGRLIVAGLRNDICSSGDAGAMKKRGVMSGPGAPCLAGYYVAAIDPKTLALTLLAKGDLDPEFFGVTTGLPLGNTLWLGSVVGNKVAYRRLR